MRVTHGSQIPSRVLILSATKKTIVDHSRASTTSQTNFCHGKNPNQPLELPCSTFRAYHTPTPTERFSIWYHSPRISPPVLVIITSHLTFVANGPRLRTRLSDVSGPTTTNSMMALLLMSTLTKCTNMTSKHRDVIVALGINALPCINALLTHYKRTPLAHNN